MPFSFGQSYAPIPDEGVVVAVAAGALETRVDVATDVSDVDEVVVDVEDDEVEPVVDEEAVEELAIALVVLAAAAAANLLPAIDPPTPPPTAAAMIITTMITATMKKLRLDRPQYRRSLRPSGPVCKPFVSAG